MHAKRCTKGREYAAFASFGFLALLLAASYGYAQVNQSIRVNGCREINQSGTYQISNDITATAKEKACITVKASNVLIDGNNKRLYGYNEFGSKTIFVWGNSTSKIRNVTIRNAKFIEDYAGVYAIDSEDVRLVSLSFDKSIIGVHIVNSSGVSVSKSRFSTEQNAIVGEGSKDISIFGSQVSSYRGNGIRLKGCSGLILSDNFLRDIPGVSLEFQDSRDIAVKRCAFEANLRGIQATGCENITISESRLLSNLEHGLSLHSSQDIGVSGNSFLGNFVGIFTQQASGITLSDNAYLENNFAVMIRNSSSVLAGDMDINNNTNAYVVHETEGFEGFLSSFNSSFRDFFFSSSNGNISGTLEQFKSASIIAERSDIRFIVESNGNITMETTLEFTFEEEEEVPLNVSIKEQRRRDLAGFFTARNLLILGVSVILIYLLSSEAKRKKRRNKKNK